MKRSTGKTIVSLFLAAVFILHVFPVYAIAAIAEDNDKLQILWYEAIALFEKREFKPALDKFEMSLALSREIGDKQAEGDILTWIADVKVQLLDNLDIPPESYVDVLNVLRQSQGIYQSINGKPGSKAAVSDVDKTVIALSLFIEAKTARAAEDYKTALAKFNALLQSIREMKLKKYEAAILMQIGYTYLQFSDLSNATVFYNEALELYKELGFSNAEITARSLIGDSLYRGGNFTIASDSYKTALQLAQKTGSRLNAARLLYSIGKINAWMGQHPEALKSYENSYTIFLQFDSESEDKHIMERVEVLTAIAEVNISLSNFIEAIKKLKQAEQLCETAKNKKALKKTYSLLSEVYLKLGRKEDASEFDNKAKAIVIDQDNTSVAEMEQLFERGRILSSQDKAEDAINILQQALSIARKNGNRIYEGQALLALGTVYHKTGQYNRAIELYKELLYISLENKSNIGKYVAMSAIAEGYYAQKQFDNAFYNDLEALAISREMGARLLEIERLKGIGHLLAVQRQYLNAIEYFEKALFISQESVVPEATWVIHDKLASLYIIEQRFKKAKHHLAEAITIIEETRGRIGIEEYQASFIENKIHVYETMIRLLLSLKQYEEAFDYLERAKSRALLDLLGNKLKIDNMKDRKASEEELILQYKIKRLMERIKKDNVQTDEKKRTSLVNTRTELEKARGEYSSFLTRIKIASPELSTLLSVNALTLKEIQALIDTDTTLLEYGVGSEGILLFVINKTDLRVFTTQIKSKELLDKINSYRDKITNLQSDYEDIAKELYSLLIEPARAYIKTSKVGIIPHAVLHYLPFQALLNDKGKFLIEEYDIFYAPSASVLKYIYEKRKDAKGKVLAFGNPKLEDDNRELPYAENEVKLIKEEYPETTIYLKDKATENKAKTLSGDYRIIHFASHGELNPTAPLFSSIRLAKDKDEDGRLEVHEIFNLDLKNTSLVTLSACETGLGKLTNGDELVGLTRGFIYAGAPSIVASLWKVNDKSTSELMSLFYKNLKTHPKSEALRMAQRELIRGKVGKGLVRGVGGVTSSKEPKAKLQEEPQKTVSGSHPYFWAPFILVGDWK